MLIPTDVLAFHEGQLYRLWQNTEPELVDIVTGQWPDYNSLEPCREWRVVPELKQIDPSGVIRNG